MMPCHVQAAETTGLANHPQAEPRALSEMRVAIADMLFELPERLDIRYLWTCGTLNYFRVNWWSMQDMDMRRIVRSAFVLVEALPDGWRIRELSERAAA